MYKKNKQRDTQTAAPHTHTVSICNWRDSVYWRYCTATIFHWHLSIWRALTQLDFWAYTSAEGLIYIINPAEFETHLVAANHNIWIPEVVTEYIMYGNVMQDKFKEWSALLLRMKAKYLREEVKSNNELPWMFSVLYFSRENWLTQGLKREKILSLRSCPRGNAYIVFN